MFLVPSKGCGDFVITLFVALPRQFLCLVYNVLNVVKVKVESTSIEVLNYSLIH